MDKRSMAYTKNNQTVMKYRDNGAIGAILDEYQKAIRELKDCISQISSDKLKLVIDEETDDPDCRSIQTVLSHVVESGYNYVVILRRHLGEELEYVPKVLLSSSLEYAQALDAMFAYNEKLFDDHPQIQIEEYNDTLKIKTRWGQSYDVDQLFEHAIVHILRHRRQIERFKLSLQN